MAKFLVMFLFLVLHSIIHFPVISWIAKGKYSPFPPNHRIPQMPISNSQRIKREAYHFNFPPLINFIKLLCPQFILFAYLSWINWLNHHINFDTHLQYYHCVLFWIFWFVSNVSTTYLPYVYIIKVNINLFVKLWKIYLYWLTLS